MTTNAKTEFEKSMTNADWEVIQKLKLTTGELALKIVEASAPPAEASGAQLLAMATAFMHVCDFFKIKPADAMAMAIELSGK